MKTPTRFVGARAVCRGFVKCDSYEAGQGRRRTPSQQQVEQQARRFWSQILIVFSLIALSAGVKTHSLAPAAGMTTPQSASASDILWRTSEPRSQKITSSAMLVA